MNMDIEVRVKKVIIFCIVVDVDSINGQIYLVEDFYVDLLDLIDIVFGFSEEFDISCNENDFFDMMIFVDICCVVKKSFEFRVQYFFFV